MSGIQEVQFGDFYRAITARVGSSRVKMCEDDKAKDQTACDGYPRPPGGCGAIPWSGGQRRSRV